MPLNAFLFLWKIYEMKNKEGSIAPKQYESMKRANLQATLSLQRSYCPFGAFKYFSDSYPNLY
jgi:hypothetical protein